jgi:CBS domain-containing membrane protein
VFTRSGAGHSPPETAAIRKSRRVARACDPKADDASGVALTARFAQWRLICPFPCYVPTPESQPAVSPLTAGHDLAHVEGLFERIGLGKFARPLPPLALWAAYVFVNGFLSIALLALLTVATGVPFIFPSLGPTAYQLFFQPRAESSTPRNTLIGHAIGLVCGYAAFRLAGMPVSVAAAGGRFDMRPVVAAALSLAATAALMILFRASHPPAGATTLIVSLGIITRPAYLAVIEAAVLLIILQAYGIHRLAGLPYPLWARREHPMSRLRWWSALKKPFRRAFHGQT